MKARDIIGRRVASVQQTRRQANYGDPVYDIERIIFDDGTILYFTVVELVDDYAVDGGVLKPERRKRGL